MSKLYKNRRGFTQAPNDIVQDKDLSFKARGLWVYLESKPDNWNFSLKRISEESTDGIDSVRSGIHELEKVGLLLREKSFKNGQFDGYDYILELEKTVSLNPCTVIPSLENPTTYKERKSNKDIKIKNVVVEQKSEKPEVPVFVKQQQQEFKQEIENSLLLNIEKTKEYLLNDIEVWRMFRQWTNNTERDIFEKVLNEFLKVETGSEGVIYPRPKGKSLFHFQKWTEKRLTDRKDLFRIAPINNKIYEPDEYD
jgi:hypothetical protein